MRQPIYVFGAGGHALSVTETFFPEHKTILFVEKEDADCVKPNQISESKFLCRKYSRCLCILAIGKNSVRNDVFIRVKTALPDAIFLNLIHPTAVVAASAKLGIGVIIMPQVVVGPNAVIKDGCILNTACVVEHECSIGAFSALAPRSVLGGNVKLGNQVNIGLGSVVRNNINITGHVFVGASSYVSKDLDRAGFWIGTPVSYNARAMNAGGEQDKS